MSEHSVIIWDLETVPDLAAAARLFDLADAPESEDDVSKILGLVARYCETDVLNTYRVWLVYELFRGSITAEQLAWCEKQMRDFVASRSSNNPHLRATVGIEKMDANDLNSDHCLRLTRPLTHKVRYAPIATKFRYLAK